MVSIKELTIGQKTLQGLIQRTIINFDKLGKLHQTLAVTKSRLETLQNNWLKYQQQHQKIMFLATEAERTDEYFTADPFTLTLDAFEAASDFLHEHLAKLSTERQGLTTQQPQVGLSCHLPIKLPEVKPPKFSGHFRDWEHFRDLFSSLVDKNTNVPKVLKLQYLRENLEGDAALILTNLTVSEANYDKAWKLLKNRYDNKRAIVNSYLHDFLQIPSVTANCAKDLKLLRDKTSDIRVALMNLERRIDEWEDLYVFIIISKLDKVTIREWELRLGGQTDVPTFQQLDEFLSTRIRALEAVELSLPHCETKEKNKSNKSEKSFKAEARSYQTIATKITCNYCKEAHLVYQCNKFRALSIPERRGFLANNKLCFNCMNKGHQAQNCSSKHSCHVCNKKHHTLAHQEPSAAWSREQSSSIQAERTRTDNQSSNTVSPSCSTTNNVVSNNLALHENQPRIGLPTACVTLQSAEGRFMRVRALLDQGSQVSCITEKVAQILKLKRAPTSVKITGVGKTDAGYVKHMSSILVKPNDDSNSLTQIDVLILKKLTTYMPDPILYNSQWTHLRDIELVDTDTRNTPIELLIGSDFYGDFLLEGLRKGPPGTPIAQQTVFGWVICGPTNCDKTSYREDVHVNHIALHDDLSDAIKRFWQLEECPATSFLSSDEENCENHFLQTHRRLADGRYEVRLPFKSSPTLLGNTAARAERIFYANETRLKRQPDLYREYQLFLREYKANDHMEEVSLEESDNNSAIYISHLAVIRESSQTTKVRVVFNASMHSSNNTSLNDTLHTGQKMQTDLITLITKWRNNRFVYTADIAKMFRQIRVAKEDCDYQRIFWREDAEVPLKPYRLTTVTYGTACAPFLANRVLKQLARDEEDKFPLAAPILANNFYVDDAMFGEDDIESLLLLRNELNSLLMAGGFKLRKWASNAKELLKDISEQEHGLAVTKSLNERESLKVLGLIWNPQSDAFHFDICLTKQKHFTKRIFFSFVAKLFDPLGWLTPVTIVSKTLMQSLWLRKIDWDEPLPKDLTRLCLEHYEQLETLTSISLPRWTGYTKNAKSIEIHGFCDASTKAYAAVVYLRVESISQQVELSLIMGKAKVAPLKVQSIPRLELCAAVLLTRCIRFVKKAMNFVSVKTVCWSDSHVTLDWLQKQPVCWKPFVANRISEIQAEIPEAQWRYVPSAQNSADCASRGLTVPKLKEKKLWWEGPAWLRESSSAWPLRKTRVSTDIELEARTSTIHAIIHKARESNIFDQFSSWPRLIRVTAYIFRFMNNCKKPRKERILEAILSIDEITNAKFSLIKMEQINVFATEINALQKGNSVSKQSPLYPLNPFIDPNGVIRVGGRIEKSKLSFEKKHPIILHKGRLATLIAEQTHKQTLHGGTQITLRVLRLQFWILNARTIVKSVIHKCVKCIRQNAKTSTQLMGDIPSERLTKSRVFSHVGVDYAGPLLVRLKPGRGGTAQKCYIAIFVCLCVRAIHIELVSDYRTETFIAALERFIARRGVPQVIYSDRGTNFQGAEKELSRRFTQLLKCPEVVNFFANDEIRWRFIPPNAPQFGGIWEAGVKSIKYHLKRVIGEFKPTYEELTTLLCKIECCLNSRPIVPLHDDLDSCEALTPGHFLVNDHLKALPQPSVLNIKENRLNRWQTVQLIQERFWRTWSTDYINSLQQRNKWRTAKENLKVGDLVLIKEPNLPPSKWELARVIETHQGSDNLVRVVTVRTATATYKRPITRICKLFSE